MVTTQETIAEQLKKRLNESDGIIALGILNAMAENMPEEELVKEIREMAFDNYNIVSRLIGEQLTQTILKS